MTTTTRERPPMARRCERCKGRRVLVITDRATAAATIIRCPRCNHPEPPPVRRHPEALLVEAIARRAA